MRIPAMAMAKPEINATTVAAPRGPKRKPAQPTIGKNTNATGTLRVANRPHNPNITCELRNNATNSARPSADPPPGPLDLPPVQPRQTRAAPPPSRRASRASTTARTRRRGVPAGCDRRRSTGRSPTPRRGKRRRVRPPAENHGIANALEPRIELQRAQDADVDDRLDDLHARHDQRERPWIAKDADEKRAEHDTRQQPVPADVGQRDGKPHRRPDWCDRSTTGGRRHDQLGEPPRDHRHERVGHDGAGEFVPGIPGAHCGGQIRELGQCRKDYSARPI